MEVTMSDIVERLHIIRAHLRTGALGQREVWEEWLTEAAAFSMVAPVEIERLRALLRRHQVCAWCELDSDLAVETRAALEPKP
jgi:hypothetical protein